MKSVVWNLTKLYEREMNNENSDSNSDHSVIAIQ